MKKFKLAYPIITDNLCPHCHQRVYTQNEYGGYRFQCFFCDEDFFSFEVYNPHSKENNNE